MAKRFTRYNTPLSIQQALPTLTGKKISIVCNNGRVFYGILYKFENGILKYQNMRLTTQEIPLGEVAEIIYDY